MKKLKKFLKKHNAYYRGWLKYPSYLRKLPIKDSAIFIESDGGSKIDGNCYYLAKELLLNPEYKSFDVFVSIRASLVEKVHDKLDEFNNNNNLHITISGSKEYYKILASAKYIFTDNTFRQHYIKKSGQVVTNVWHGTPLKTLGKYDKENFHKNGILEENL